MTATYDDATIEELEASFIARNDQIIRWSDAISQMQMLPGLRGLWPMSAFDASGNAFDLSGNGRTLTRAGNSGYSYDNYGRVPYFFGDGTGDYLSRADEAGLDITGTEAYVVPAVKGLTLGGWFWVSAFGVNNATFISKYNAAANRSHVLFASPAGLIEGRVSLAGGATVAVTGITINAGQWYHLVFRFEPSSELALFQNGEKNANVVGIPASIFNSNADFMIGGIQGGSWLLNGRASLCHLQCAYLPDSAILSIFHSQKHFFGV